MTEPRCDASLSGIRIPYKGRMDVVNIHCTLPPGHDEAHRAVIFWPSSRDLISIDEPGEGETA